MRNKWQAEVRDDRLMIVETKLSFRMDSDKLNYFGRALGVDLYVIEIDEESCVAKGVNYIDQWYAGYVKMSNKCDLANVVLSLQTDGADFLFINYDGLAPTINPRVLSIPVFLVNPSKDSLFIDTVEKTFEARYKKYQQEIASGKKQASPYIKPLTRLTISFPHKQTAGKDSEIGFYYSSANIRTFEYIEALERVYSVLKDYIKFTPYVVVYKLMNDGRGKRSKNCYLGTVYCAADPDGEGEFTGGDVVLESLKEKCIFAQSKVQWFKYMKEYGKNCHLDYSEKCATRNMEPFGIDPKSITQCVNSSQLGVSENSLLRSDFNKVKEMSDLNYPAITINENTYLGHLDPNVIGNSICETLDPVPEACKEFEARTVVNTEQNTSMFYSVLTYFFFIIIGLLVLALICICVARRAAYKDINDEVKKGVANYFNMREVESLQ